MKSLMQEVLTNGKIFTRDTFTQNIEIWDDCFTRKTTICTYSYQGYVYYHKKVEGDVYYEEFQRLN